MAARVIRAHEIDDALEVLSTLVDDPVPRVRTAAERARIALTRAAPGSAPSKADEPRSTKTPQPRQRPPGCGHLGRRVAGSVAFGHVGLQPALVAGERIWRVGTPDDDQLGSKRPEVISVAILMNGGPATVYGPRAWAAFDELAAPAEDDVHGYHA